MTSSTPKIQAVKNGTTTRQTEPAHQSVGDLRRTEAMALISLVCDSMSTTRDLAHVMHNCIYKELDTTPMDQVKERLYAALTCMETADHYLRMLDEVLADIPVQPHPDPYDGEAPF
jgi:hypothetical protein